MGGFRLICEEIMRNIPDVLVAARTIVHNQYNASKTAHQPRGGPSGKKQLFSGHILTIGPVLKKCQVYQMCGPI